MRSVHFGWGLHAEHCEQHPLLVSGDFAEFSEHEASARTARETRVSTRIMPVQRTSRKKSFSTNCGYQALSSCQKNRLFSKRSNTVVTQSSDCESSHDKLKIEVYKI